MADTQVGHYNGPVVLVNGGHAGPPLLFHHYTLFGREKYNIFVDTIK